jgi:16S rRNA (cytosine1402-N4)-methyltransferase
MHKPVLLNEVLKIASEKPIKRLLDATFGRGGHTRALLGLPAQPLVVGLDQDVTAIEFGRAAFSEEIAKGRLSLIHGSFHALNTLDLGGNFDFILADLGVSSPQLDEAERGFSFYHEGPLDMRMNQSSPLSAREVINTWPEVELLRLFQAYGEIRRPHRVVRALVKDRQEKPFQTTRELAGLIERVEGWRKKGQHPATRFFLAIRMAVNNELEGLTEALPALMQALSEDGRLVVITFHSLEDRIIKYAFREATELGFPLYKKVVVPSREEETENPRARSAKLRVFQRGVRS